VDHKAHQSAGEAWTTGRILAGQVSPQQDCSPTKVLGRQSPVHRTGLFAETRHQLGGGGGTTEAIQEQETIAHDL
jgi:hypothetical protein